jgi:hypothetical protein
LNGLARFLALISLLGFALLLAPDAIAQRVVLVQTGKQDPLLVDAWHRLLAELRIHNFESETVELVETADLAEALAETARARGAIAAIALIHRNETTAVDVWLIDRMTGKTTLRRIVVNPGEDASSVLAIRAVDLLRASFREFGLGQRPPEDVAGVDRRPVPRAVEDLSAEPPRVFSLLAGAMVLVQFPGFGAAFGPTLGGFVRTTDRSAVGLVVAGPVMGAEFSGANGSASMTQALGIFEARLAVVRARAFEVGPTVAFGAYHLGAAGRAAPPLVSKDDDTWAAIGGGGVFFQARLWSRVAASVSARVFGILPPVGVAVGDESAVIRFPVVEASLGVMVDL